MSFSIQTNVSSLVAQENLRVNSDFQARTISRLTSGYRINASGDDAAGLAVANKFRSDVSELSQGVRNANDGISTLQIIDGGLNNISKMLDRLKTLATQSASATFSGSRSTLNTEYKALLAEIDRQAENVGLGTGAYGGRYNKSIAVYVGGGGETQANSKVDIDLAGTSNRVDSTGLAISATSIDGSGATKISANGVDLDQGTTILLLAADSQTITFNVNDGSGPAYTFQVTVSGSGGASATGKTGAEMLADLNAALKNHGIAASANATDGTLQFSGDVAFTASLAATTNAHAGFTTATNTATVYNGSMYRASGQATFDAIDGDATDTETLTVTNADGNKATIVLTAATGADAAAALAELNNSLEAIGVYAVKNAAGTGIEFQSAASFTISSASNANASQGVFGADGAGVVAQDTTSTNTTAAEAAITALTSAVAALGAVQGKVGTAQNKLVYSIQLAQSQISNFSAAESRIRDADVAAEAANLTKAQVLQQASLAAMAQANTAPQAVLGLLRG